MRLKFFPPYTDEGEVIASWGQAKLIKYWNGKLELKGGSREDHTAAKEWISLFCHNALIRFPG